MEAKQEEILKKWEPKLHSMMRGTFIRGMDYEDIVQELRIVLLRAAKGYREGSPASFHTYLHVALTNAIRTMISKAKNFHDNEPIENNDFLDLKEDDNDFFDLISKYPLNPAEAIVLDFLLCGYNVSEIKRFCVSPSAVSKTMKALQKKFGYLKNERNLGI